MKNILSTILIVAVVVMGAIAEAQQPTKIPRIGFLSATSPSAIAARVEAFRRGLRELGYVEGKNIVIEWRYAERKLDRLSELAAELVRLKVDVIVSAGPPLTLTAKQATATIPIVMATGVSVDTGLNDGATGSPRNVTGLSDLAPGLSARRLELLKQVVP
ncbi:MAG: ABC transporter substrate binding protein, partial [Sulfuricaulis sp.]|nr:ABC transporter substrate binding protein [Sulfuricaulis sp.]